MRAFLDVVNQASGIVLSGALNRTLERRRITQVFNARDTSLRLFNLQFETLYAIELPPMADRPSADLKDPGAQRMDQGVCRPGRVCIRGLYTDRDHQPGRWNAAHRL